MSQINTSRAAPVAMSGLPGITSAASFCEGRERNSVQQPSASPLGTTRRSPRPCVHHSPWGGPRATGSEFNKPGHMRAKDLTSWEQQRAGMPERSYGFSANTCVARPLFQPLAPPPSSLSAVPQGPPASSSAPTSPHSIQLPPPSPPSAASAQAKQKCGRPPRPSPVSVDQEILTPVCITSPEHAFNATMCPNRGDAFLRVARSAPPARPRGGATSTGRRPEHTEAIGETDSELRVLQERRKSLAGELDNVAQEEMRQLQQRRQRLAAELRRTEQRLRVVSVASDLAVEEVGTPHGGTPVGTPRGNFGGGGALRSPRPQPSAGGPFAGRSFLTSHAERKTVDTSKNIQAGDAYSYLGPGSDGPALPDIHPMWT